MEFERIEGGRKVAGESAWEEKVVVVASERAADLSARSDAVRFDLKVERDGVGGTLAFGERISALLAGA
jgi:hypothetical protein